MYLIITKDENGRFWVEQCISRTHGRGITDFFQKYAGPFDTLEDAERCIRSARRTPVQGGEYV